MKKNKGWNDNQKQQKKKKNENRFDVEALIIDDFLWKKFSCRPSKHQKIKLLVVFVIVYEIEYLIRF